MDRITVPKLRMPAEWEPHEATWIAWPHERSDWPGKFAPIQWVYGEIAARLARVERVRIVVADERQQKEVRRVLQKCHANLNAIDLWIAPTDRSWLRDTCAIFARDSTGKRVALDWHFNGWAKYGNWKDDDKFPAFAAKKLKIERITPKVNGKKFVLEGGSIDVNGQGDLLTTEECLLSPVQARNPHLTKEEIEAALGQYLGAHNILWLNRGIAGDDTHGHIDDLARFTDATTVVIAAEPERADENYEPLKENLARLKKMKTAGGNSLKVATLPMPRPIWFDNQRLPASYVNFYIANSLVLVPVFNDPNDRIALNTMAMLFPSREICPIYCGDLVLGLGTLHCLTQQEIFINQKTEVELTL